MFLSYYGLVEQPFGVTPDARFLYMSASHREALASLQYGIETGRGFLALVAGPGMGKTTLLFELMEHLQGSARTVFLFQRQSTSTELLVNLLADLGLEPVRGDIGAIQSQLNQVLVREAQLGRRFVLVIDEAQNLNDEVLESVRMLSNFETQSSKLMQIVLAGQPQLADKLAQANLTQLRQRMSMICHLDPLSPEEAVRYIDNRLRIAGYKGGPLFTPDALRMILDRSAGIPRNINNICFHTLSLGCAMKQKKIGLPIVQEVISDLSLELLGSGHNQGNTKSEYSTQAGSTREVPSNGETGRQPPGYPDSNNRNYSATTHFARDIARPDRRPHGPVRTFFMMLLLLLSGAVAWGLSIGHSSNLTQAARRETHRLLQSAANHVPEKVTVAENRSALPGKGPSTAAGKNSTPAPAPSDFGTGISRFKTQELGTTGDDPGPSSGHGVQGSHGVPPTSHSYAETRPGSPASPGGSAFTRHQPTVSLDPSHESARRASAVNTHRLMAKRELGELFVQSNVRNARVYINGKSDPSWLTPHTFLLPVGTYWVSVRKEGRTAWSQAVHVSKGGTQWSVADLRHPSAVVEIETQPPGVPVFIDGQAYGPSPVEGTLSAGEHTYKAIPRHGGQPYIGTFFLKPNDILRVTVKWPDAGRPSAGKQMNRFHDQLNSRLRTGGALE